MAQRAKALAAKAWKPEFKLWSRHKGEKRKNGSNKSSSDLYMCCDILHSCYAYYTNAMTYYTRAMTHASLSLSHIMIVTVTHKNTTDFRKIATEG